MTGPETSSDAVVIADATDLLRFVTEVLVALGTEDAAAADMAGQIVGSEIAGHESHGLRRLPEYVAHARRGGAQPASTGRIELDRGSLVRIDGERGFGHVVMTLATRLAVERARVHGIAAVTVRNAAEAGRFADFCERAAAQGIATLVFVNDGGGGQVMAPPGGTEARLSTNPIAFGFPRAAAPHLVVDMATSAVAMGRVSEWRDRGEPIPPEWATEDGVLLPVGGVKGFGLALIAEALGGALASAGTVSAEAEDSAQGVLLIAIDAAALRPLPDLTEEVERFVAYVRDVPRAPGAASVRIPGESSALTARQRLSQGSPVQEFSWAAMHRLAEEFSLRPPGPIDAPV